MRRREDFFADERLVHYEWKARYEVEEQENEKQERKLEDYFESAGWLFRHLNTRFPRVLIARLHMSVARMYFVKVWLIYQMQFLFYFLECFMFIRAT